MAGWESFLFGWGDITLDLEAGDVLAGGEDIFAGELHLGGGGGGVGVFESPRLRRKLQQQPRKTGSQAEVVLTLGPGDAIASGEPIEIAITASKPAVPVVVTNATIQLTPCDAVAEGESIEVEGEHRGVFVIAGDVVRVTREPELVRFRVDARGLVHDVTCGSFDDWIGAGGQRVPCHACVGRKRREAA